jgi:hypothetical protein
MLLRAGDQGMRVSELHRQLILSGLLDPQRAACEIAALRFGPDTQMACLVLQAQLAQPMSGRADALLWEALQDDNQPEARPPPAYEKMGAFSAQVLRHAEADYRAGVREEARGARRGKRVDEFLAWHPGAGDQYLRHRHAPHLPPDGWQGAPFSALGAARWVTESALRLGETSPIAGWGDLATAAKWADGAHAHRRLVRDPAPGRVGLIGHNGCLLHVALIADVTPLGIETREADSAGWVSARVRAPGDFRFFVDLEAVQALGALAPSSVSEQLTRCLLCHQPLALCPYPTTCPHRGGAREPCAE